MKHPLFHLKVYLPFFVLIVIAFGITLSIMQQNLDLIPEDVSQGQEAVLEKNVLAGSTACFNGGWGTRKKISFSSSGTLVNFPVLVKLDSNRITYSKTRDNGADLRFEDPSSPGTFLPYEIETWNPGGTSFVWVKVPQIDASNSDYIWMYYDNPSASDAQQRNAVWDSSYKGVWHLGSIFYDSTSNGNNGTNNNTTSGEGLMGNASNFAGTSTADQYIAIPNSSSINFGTTQNYTLEAWVKVPQDQNHRANPDNDIVSKWTHDTSPPVNPYPYNLRTTNSSSTVGAGEIYSNRYDANGVNPNCSSLPSKFNNNSWIHVAAVKNGSGLSLYINGSSVCSATDTTTATTTNSDPLYFGRRVSPRNWFTGSIDEVRLSNTNRSADWIKAAYNSSRDAMNSFGSEELCQTTSSGTSSTTNTIIAAPTATPTPTPYPATVYKTPTPTPYASTASSGSTATGGYAWPTTSYTQVVQNNSQTTQSTATFPWQPTPTPIAIDRLANQDPAILKCISSLLSSDELERLRFLQPRIASEQTELNQLQEKVKVCFQTFTEVVKIQEASRQISNLPEEQKQCVVRAIGLPAYEQIQSGMRQPTQEEKVTTQSCFEKQATPQITYQTKDKPLDSSIDSCLVLALGNDKYGQLKSGRTQPTIEEREKINRCFGANPNPLTNKPKYVVPQEIETCMKSGTAVARLNAIQAGTQEPTKEEKVKVKNCFAQMNEVQAKLLPPPPAQVPYLETAPEKVKINVVTPTTEKTADAKTDNAVVLRGKSLPNSVVSLYVFSDPIVVETTTDANGDWVYKLNEPLEQGSHLAYATIRAESGEQVRSSVFNFSVAFAAVPTSAIAQQYFAENSSSSVPSRFIDSSLIMIAGSIVLAGIIIAIIVLKSQQAKAASALDGQGKGENTSGSVN